MLCEKCGKENDLSNQFCVHCGEKLNKEGIVLKKEIPVAKEEKENPTAKEEKMLKIVNSIFGVILMYGVILFLGFLILNLFLAGLSGEMEDFMGAGISGVIIVVMAVFLMIFNIVIGKKMYEKNKEVTYVGLGVRVNKVSYALKTYFLGMLGVHKFSIGDKKGGMLRLGLTALGVLFVGFFSGSAMVVIAFYIGLLCWGISFGLTVSDVTIVLSKVSDENKMISL